MATPITLVAPTLQLLVKATNSQILFQEHARVCVSVCPHPARFAVADGEGGLQDAGGTPLLLASGI